jgi:hypothetical protein
MKISKEELLGIVRHGLTFIGGIVITGGLIDSGLFAELTGGVLTLTGVIWSILDKRKKA